MPTDAAPLRVPTVAAWIRVPTDAAPVSALISADLRRVALIGARAAVIVAQHPEIVFVTTGLNDNFSFHVANTQIYTPIIGDLSGLKAQLPDARFPIKPFWYSDTRPATVGVITGWVREQATPDARRRIASE